MAMGSGIAKETLSNQITNITILRDRSDISRMSIGNL
jgi:hypothetical protein